jgi:chaperonin GroES
VPGTDCRLPPVSMRIDRGLPCIPEVALGAVVGQDRDVTDLGRVWVPGLDILNTVDTQSRRHSVEAVRHQLRPLFDQVVVKELDSDRMRRSGLVVPAGTHDPPPQQGIVLAVGPGLDWWEQAGVEMPVQPGDHVVFPASAGVWVEVDEERLLVCRVVELLGILESAHAEPAQG